MAASDPHYQYHLFFCTNLRVNGAPCCGEYHAQQARDHAKKRIESLKSILSGRIRVNNAGCLDRCGSGPVVVIYPEGTWYTYKNQDDIDEIIDEHLIHGRVLERLKI
ncbi:(2Fe-2S) ferredoxin domain-containing protein [Gammaproteobacteria bacterium]